MVKSEIIYLSEVNKLQLRIDKEQQQGYTPGDGQGWETMLDSFHHCAYLIQLAQDHSIEGVKITDPCKKESFLCRSRQLLIAMNVFDLLGSGELFEILNDTINVICYDGNDL